MKLVALALSLLWMGGTGTLSAQENAYDVLGKALRPIANVFAVDEDGNAPVHGLVLDAHLLQASKLPTELQGQAAHLAVQTPDKLLVQAPKDGQTLTVCRDGDALWATPGSKIQYLLEQAEAASTPGKKKKKHLGDAARLLGPMVLPVPAKNLVFLPVLFQVQDQGSAAVGGETCRVLDVQLMDQLAHSLHAEGWTARMWIGADYQIVQVALTGPDWSGTVAIDKLAFPDKLPDGTFQAQGTDVMRLTSQQFVSLLEHLGRGQ